MGKANPTPAERDDWWNVLSRGGCASSLARSLSPVGGFKGDVSPYGCLDMAGNVTEWTSSLRRLYPYVSGDGREDQAAPGIRAARGGSWNIGWGGALVSARWGDLPERRSGICGVRCAITAGPHPRPAPPEGRSAERWSRPVAPPAHFSRLAPAGSDTSTGAGAVTR